LQLKVALASAVITLICFVSLNYNKVDFWIFYHRLYREEFKAVEKCLDEIPHDKSVLTTDYFAPYLFRQKELFLAQTYAYSFKDFLVVDAKDPSFKPMINNHLESGFEEVCRGGFVIVLRNLSVES
jgi:hypothetical protein